MFAHLADMRLDDVKMFGGLLGVSMDEESEHDTDEEIAKRLADPLYDFPFDTRFYSDKEIEYFSEKSKRAYELYISGKADLNPEALGALWLDTRVAAARGSDIVAKRAAQVDPLWLKYRDWVERHGRCSEDRLRHFIEIDIARSQLYPLVSVPEQEKMLQERWAKERAEGLPLTVVSDKLPPPEWYVDHLKAAGRYEGIVTKINQVLGRRVLDN